MRHLAREVQYLLELPEFRRELRFEGRRVEVRTFVSGAVAAPGHVCPGIRIHAIDIVQAPGIGMRSIADMVYATCKHTC